MRKSLIGLILIFIFLTTYTPNEDIDLKSVFIIKKIDIDNNSIISNVEIERKLAFLYEESLLFLNKDKIEKNLKMIPFLDSFSLKKIYPDKIKFMIYEKKPIAVLIDKTNKHYISEKGKLIKYKNIKEFANLPTVFGGGKHFFALYIDLKEIMFPLEMINSFRFFESGRWDLVMINKKIIKLPVQNYLQSLKNYMDSKGNSNFNKYKIFDYRIKDQLILN